MHRKILLMVICMSAILLLSACSKGDVGSSSIDVPKKVSPTSSSQGDVDLSFIDVPKKVSIYSYMFRNEVNAINEKLKKGQNTLSKEAQQKLINKELAFYEAATLEIEDEAFIKTVFDTIKKGKASVWNSNRTGPLDESDESYSCFVLKITDESRILTDEHLFSLTIFNDGSAYLFIDNPKKTTILKTTILKINLKTSDFDYIQKYFDDHKR